RSSSCCLARCAKSSASSRPSCLTRSCSGVSSKPITLDSFLRRRRFGAEQAQLLIGRLEGRVEAPVDLVQVVVKRRLRKPRCERGLDVDGACCGLPEIGEDTRALAGEQGGAENTAVEHLQPPDLAAADVCLDLAPEVAPGRTSARVESRHAKPGC